MWTHTRIVGFSDADWAGSSVDKQSTKGFCRILMYFKKAPDKGLLYLDCGHTPELLISHMLIGQDHVFTGDLPQSFREGVQTEEVFVWIEVVTKNLV